MVSHRQFPDRKLFAGLLAVWAAFLVSAVAADSSSRIRFTTLSKSSRPGLKSNVVRDIIQDLSGPVYIATDQGVSRFDGYETVHFREEPGNPSSLSSNHITALATNRAEHGPIWLGTSSRGLVILNQKTGKASRIQKGTPSGKNLLSNMILDLAVSEDKFLWIGTEQGLNVLSIQTGEITVPKGIPEQTSISFVICLRDHDVWVGTTDGSLYQWTPKESYFAKRWETTVPVTSLIKDAKGKIWIGTAGKGLFSCESGEKLQPKQVEFDSSHVTSLFIDSDMKFWVGTLDGLALLDDQNQSFSWFQENPSRAKSLTDNHVTQIYEDHSKMLWVATEGGGASRFSLDREWFAHLRPNSQREDDLPDPVVRTVSPGPNGKVWIGTDQGLACWNPESTNFEETPVIPAILNESLTDLHWGKTGDLWIATRGEGLVRYTPAGKVEHYKNQPDDPTSLGHNNVQVVHETFEGELLVGTQGAGLLRYKPSAKSFAPVSSQSKGSDQFIQTVAEDLNGNVWVATRTGLQIYFGGTKKMLKFSEVYPDAAPFSSNQINAILPDANGIIWLGTAGSGLDRLNTENGDVRNFNSAISGLPDDEIRSLIKDDNGFLWVITRTGIARLNTLQTEFRVFSYEDGLQRDGFCRESVARASGGTLFVGGFDGINIIDPSDLPDLQLAPNTILTGFEYYGKPEIPSPDGILKKTIAASDEIRIPFDKRLRFAITFGNLDFRFPSRGQFRYKLDRYEDWRLAEEDRKASYSALPPGKYMFRAQSSLDGRQWPESSASIQIIITPPWYQTWWFLTLWILLVVFATVGVTRYLIQSRVRQLREREQRLTAQRDKAEAELGRQLQNRVLLDRTASEFSKELREDQILSEPLEGITEKFDATHCIVHRIVTEEDEKGNSRQSLKRIGYFGNDQGQPGSVPPWIAIDQPLVTRVLQSTGAVVVSNTGDLPKSIWEPFGESVPITLISGRTTFLDSANGLITLLRVGKETPWSSSDRKLIEALTGQFGIAIAQLNTAATEKRYRRHLEDAKHAAEVANRAKSDFLAKMTHELRTPLNSIIGFSEILGEDRTLNARQCETLDIINNSGEHLLDVVNEILDLSKIEAGKVELNAEEFSILPMLRSVYEMLAMKADAKRIAFNFAAHSTMPGAIRTDRSKLRQILINLIGNAIKFTSQGAVSLSVKATALSDPREIDHRLSRRVRIDFEIMDTGRGITAEELPRLFERYSQTETGRRSSEGTGLGLPIAKSFVELLGGELEVESIFGEGTIFRFHIECEELAAVQTDETKLGMAIDESTAQRIIGFDSPQEEVRILIAEDQPSNRLLLRKILGKAGFSITEAENGKEAVKKWKEWKPHLIFMDEDMPELNGSEATRQIKAITSQEDDPVIVSLTAYALDHVRSEAIKAGCTDFVAKPFRSHELFSMISKHLGVNYVFRDAA